MVWNETSTSFPVVEYHSMAPSLPLSWVVWVALGSGIFTPVESALPKAAACSLTVAVRPRLTTLGWMKPRAVLSQTFIAAGLVPMPHCRPSQEPLAMMVQKPLVASPVVLE